MKFKLKPITTNSWIIFNDTGETKLGLLSEIRNNYILMCAGVRQQFADKTEVVKYFQEDIFESIPELEVKEEVKELFIQGFPVDFDSPIEVVNDKLPLFTKRAASNVIYAAGYYCLDFPKNTMPAYCPKLSTLEAYAYKGPFKTEMEMKEVMRKRRQERQKSI